MSIHYRAVEHLQKARRLLSSGDDDALRYAALELRYAIEHLFYRLIPAYKDELPQSVLDGSTWQPSAIIDMITEIDPGVENDQTLSFGFESAPGVPTGEMFVLGQQSGLSRALLRKTYHRLGSFLHARVDGEPHDPAMLRDRLGKLLPLLDKFEGDRVIASGLAAKVTFKCDECGRTLVKRYDSVSENPYLVCGNRGCEAIYKFSYTAAEGTVFHELLQENVKCQKCDADNWVGHHKLKRGAEDRALLTCQSCRTRYRMSPYIQLSVVESDADAE